MKKISIPLILLLFSVTTLTIAQTTTDGTSNPVQRKGRPDIPGTFLIELGFNSLQDAPSIMDVKAFGSKTVNLYYFRNVDFGHFSFLPGFGLGLDRYKFDEDITLVQGVDTDGNTVVDIADISDLDIKKSLLISNYFDIPLELRFYTNPGNKKRSFNIGIGGKGGIRFSSHTKVKYEEDGNNVKRKDKKDYELNRFRYGITGRIGIGGFNFFYYQSLSDFFDGNGPAGTEDAANITIGLSFTGF